MGISFSSSCPFADSDDLTSGFESVIVKSISFGNGEGRTDTRSMSLRDRDSDEPTIVKSLGSGNTIVEGSISFNRMRMGTTVSITSVSPGQETNSFVRSSSNKIRHMDDHTPRSESFKESNPQSPISDNGEGKHEAAVKLQKVYKSFRTRRKLADCAVLVEQSWWKLLDFAELKHSSISFFDIEKHESAISRWSRAKNRAAKVGKGLSKNNKAQKLALQHWLEAIDPRHRYGHNLHFYYVKWLHSQSHEPFFYWLDIGEGKEVNLVEKCPRTKLQQQCIKYLGPMERKSYEVVVEDGKFFYKQSGELLDTTGGLKDAKWIFVLSASKSLYIGQKKKGTFQHSSFLAGGTTTAAGRLVIENGILKAVWPHSGHYRPTEENFKDFIAFLKENNVDLTDVKTCSADEEEEPLNRQKSSLGLRSQPSEEDLKEANSETEENSIEELTQEQENNELMEKETDPSSEQQKTSWIRSLNNDLTNLEIPKRNILSGAFENKSRAATPSGNVFSVESPLAGYETAEETFPSEEDHIAPKPSISDEKHEENEIEIIPEESILKRINSHKGMKSYQLGKQLSCKWTSGAGPRIGCVRDYPSGLQFQALEKVNLSPRSACKLKSYFSPRSTCMLSPKVSPAP